MEYKELRVFADYKSGNFKEIFRNKFVLKLRGGLKQGGRFGGDRRGGDSIYG